MDQHLVTASYVTTAYIIITSYGLGLVACSNSELLMKL
jgi:hypothetical protein